MNKNIEFEKSELLNYGMGEYQAVNTIKLLTECKSIHYVGKESRGGQSVRLSIYMIDEDGYHYDITSLLLNMKDFRFENDSDYAVQFTYRDYYYSEYSDRAVDAFILSCINRFLQLAGDSNRVSKRDYIFYDYITK